MGVRAKNGRELGHPAVGDRRRLEDVMVSALDGAGGGEG